MTPCIVRTSITRDELREMAKSHRRSMVKAVVDIERALMSVGGEMHADEEAALLDDGSLQENLWGINIWPDNPADDRIEFDSMINLRPSQHNNSRGVESEATRTKIKAIVNTLVIE
ncbi:MAG: DUF5674 family protein [Patescibacteria group bacterium]